MRMKKMSKQRYKQRYWFDKASLCRMIIAIVGPEKYGKKLWNMTNIDLEDIYDKEKEEREKHK